MTSSRGKSPMAAWRVLPLVAALVLGHAAAQHSEPLVHDSQATKGGNKFKTRNVEDIEKHIFGTHANEFDPTTACPHRVYQHWATEVDSSVYTTPVIFDVASDGVKDIVVPAFAKHVEVLHGPTGHNSPGFPFTFPNSVFYASPLIYDINKDGEPDIGVTSFDGELIWLTENGMPLIGKSLKIPHLKVRKKWYEGLQKDPQDMGHETQFEDTFAKQFLDGWQTQSSRDPVEKRRKEYYGYDDIRRKRVEEDTPAPAPDFDFGLPELSPEQHVEKTMKFDADGDGSINENEFHQFTLEHPHGTELNFVTVDKNSDGHATPEELLRYFSEDYEDDSNPYNYDPHKQDFVKADLNHDGKLSKSEFKKDILKDQPDMTDKAVDMLWGKADSNKDGLVSRKEARAHWEDFDREDGLPRKEHGVDKDQVMDKALKALLEKHPELGKAKEAKTPTPDHPSWNKGGGKRRLLQDDGEGGGEPVVPPEGGGEAEEVRFDGGGEDSEGDADAYQGEVQGEGQGGEDGADGGAGDEGEGEGEGEDDSGPKDGEELIDGEDYHQIGTGDAGDSWAPGVADDHYEDPYGDHYGYHDYDDDYYHYRHHERWGKPQTSEELIKQKKEEKARQRKEAYGQKPLHEDEHSTWSTLKGYFAPVDVEETDPGQKTSAFGYHEDFLRKHVLGNDEVFTRMMSMDRHHAERNLEGRNASKPHAGQRPVEEGYVFVDAHVLCTPIIADLDGDGHDEVIFSVSYYFDREQYSDPAMYEDLDLDVKINKYVAGGVAAYDLATGQLKWHTHLDLTTDETLYRAYIYSSPSVADLDGDGILEVVVATSLGFIYVLEAKGEVREGFPVTMAEIQGQVGIADINDDGQLELIAADNRHNIAAFSSKGKELWERHMSGFSTQGPTLGDINGDGIVDVVLATSSGHIWAMNGKNGDSLPNFPVKLGGEIMSPPLILAMGNAGQGPTGLPVRHVVVPSHDGYLNVVDGSSGCTFKYDIGEKAYSMVLADDVTGNGQMDLIVSTMNGNIINLGTEVPYDAIKSWTSREVGNNNVEMRDGRQGIVVTPEYRSHRDNVGATMMMGFEIVDTRPVKGFGKGKATYKVKISVGGNTVLFAKTYDSPGKYLEELPCPARRQYSTIYVQMVNELGQHFEDKVAMSFNMRFYRALKWVLVIPFLAMTGVIVFIKEMDAVLPV